MPETPGAAQGRTYFDKVWDDHVIADMGDNTFLLSMDRLFLHDLSGSAALIRLEQSGRGPALKNHVFAVIDHVVDTRPGHRYDSPRPGGTELMVSMRELCNKHGLNFFDVDDPRQGIVHVVAPEQGVALPGLTLVCGDSHTCTLGGVGALAFGIGSSECLHVLATQALPQIKPKNMRVTYSGALGKGVFPKDMVLALIGRIGANGGIGYAVEFAGPVIADMSVEGRLTICNMAIEFSAKYGFVPPDERTIEYVKGRPFSPKGADWDAAVAYWRAARTDANARFDREEAIDCNTLTPQVTWGTSPQLVVGVADKVPDPKQAADAGVSVLMKRALEYMKLNAGAQMTDVPIDGAFIGSCTNARISDLRLAAQVLKGRKVADGVTAICIPGSTEVKKQAEAEGLDRIISEAGFQWRESGCGYCAYIGGDEFLDKRVVTSTNRNFENRQGPKTRSHLASPATVAASAIRGRITDPREFLA
ncbi:MAG: 3-isopropylmalate dehydratase large subunit [Hyphomicrobiaceae bacterium]